MSKFCIRKGLLVSISSQLNLAANKLTSLFRYTLSGLVMSGYETDDYVFNTCETVEVQDSLGRYVAAIFRKPPNGSMFAAFPSMTCQLINLSFLTFLTLFTSEFEVHGACLVRNELKQKDLRGSPRRFYRNLRIVTSSGGVLDIERHGSNGILLITLSLMFVTRKNIKIQVHDFSPFKITGWKHQDIGWLELRWWTFERGKRYKI